MRPKSEARSYQEAAVVGRACSSTSIIVLRVCVTAPYVTVWTRTLPRQLDLLPAVDAAIVMYLLLTSLPSGAPLRVSSIATASQPLVLANPRITSSKTVAVSSTLHYCKRVLL